MSPCLDRDFFGDVVDLSMDNATVLVSNLGGQGGQTGSLDVGAGTPPIILLGNVGVTPDGVPINLEIRNMTPYVAFNTLSNGLKAKPGGSFGLINLRAPQDTNLKLSLLQAR